MDQRALGSSAASLTDSQTEQPRQARRGAWVLTAYGISGLALLAVLAFYFSNYVTR